MRTSWKVWGLLLALGACAPGDALHDRQGADLSLRPADGLLDSPALQDVVEAAVRRDGASLRALFRAEDPVIRARAAYAMASIRDLGAAPELRALLEDPDPRVRADAAFALAHYAGNGDAGDQMTELLATERDPAVRAALVDALGKAGYSRSIGVLRTLAGEDRAGATLALSRSVVRGSAPGAAVDTLVARMADPDPAIRRNAAYFMERVDNPMVWVDHRGDIRSALDAMPLDDPAAMSIVDGLGRRFDVFSLPRILIRARSASDWRVRANAMAALEGMGLGEERLRTLLAGLDDPSPHVRAQAAATLGEAPPADDVQAFLVDWIGRRPDDRLALGPVLRVLARVGNEPAVLGWVDGLDPSDEAGWIVAIPALGELAGQGALEALLRAAGSPEARVARAAAAALVERAEAARGFGGEAVFVELLGRAVAEANPVTTPALARALADAALAPTGGRDRLAAAWSTFAGAEAPQRRAAVVDALVAVDAADLLPAAARPVASPGDEEVEVDASARVAEMRDAARGDPVRTVPELAWTELRALGTRPRLVLDTDQGRIVLVLAADEAPLTVQTLTRLAADGAFDGVPFHRVVSNFVIQAGDLARGPDPRLAPRLRTEVTRIPFERGVVGMANTGSLDTESSQFFITHDRQPHLDGGYTAFGRVVQGMGVVDRIQPGDRIVRASVWAGG